MKKAKPRDVVRLTFNDGSTEEVSLPLALLKADASMRKYRELESKRLEESQRERQRERGRASGAARRSAEESKAQKIENEVAAYIKQGKDPQRYIKKIAGGVCSEAYARRVIREVLNRNGGQ